MQGLPYTIAFIGAKSYIPIFSHFCKKFLANPDMISDFLSKERKLI